MSVARQLQQIEEKVEVQHSALQESCVAIVSDE